MAKINLLASCRFLLIVNTVFWLFAASYFSFFAYPGNNSYLTIKVLLFAEPALYFVALIGIIKKIRLIYLFSLLLALGNAVLSVTDEIDLSDVISLVLSVLVFISLISIRSSIFVKKPVFSSRL
jgi:hypothetical protein